MTFPSALLLLLLLIPLTHYTYTHHAILYLLDPQLLLNRVPYFRAALRHSQSTSCTPSPVAAAVAARTPQPARPIGHGPIEAASSESLHDGTHVLCADASQTYIEAPVHDCLHGPHSKHTGVQEAAAAGIWSPLASPADYPGPFMHRLSMDVALDPECMPLAKLLPNLPPHVVGQLLANAPFDEQLWVAAIEPHLDPAMAVTPSVVVAGLWLVYGGSLDKLDLIALPDAEASPALVDDMFTPTTRVQQLLQQPVPFLALLALLEYWGLPEEAEKVAEASVELIDTSTAVRLRLLSQSPRLGTAAYSVRDSCWAYIKRHATSFPAGSLAVLGLTSVHLMISTSETYVPDEYARHTLLLQCYRTYKSLLQVLIAAESAGQLPAREGLLLQQALLSDAMLPEAVDVEASQTVRAWLGQRALHVTDNECPGCQTGLRSDCQHKHVRHARCSGRWERWDVERTRMKPVPLAWDAVQAFALQGESVHFAVEHMPTDWRALPGTSPAVLAETDEAAARKLHGALATALLDIAQFETMTAVPVADDESSTSPMHGGTLRPIRVPVAPYTPGRILDVTPAASTPATGAGLEVPIPSSCAPNSQASPVQIMGTPIAPPFPAMAIDLTRESDDSSADGGSTEDMSDSDSSSEAGDEAGGDADSDAWSDIAFSEGPSGGLLADSDASPELPVHASRPRRRAKRGQVAAGARSAAPSAPPALPPDIAECPVLISAVRSLAIVKEVLLSNSGAMFQVRYMHFETEQLEAAKLDPDMPEDKIDEAEWLVGVCKDKLAACIERGYSKFALLRPHKELGNTVILQSIPSFRFGVELRGLLAPDTQVTARNPHSVSSAPVLFLGSYWRLDVKRWVDMSLAEDSCEKPMQYLGVYLRRTRASEEDVAATLGTHGRADTRSVVDVSFTVRCCGAPGSAVRNSVVGRSSTGKPFGVTGSNSFGWERFLKIIPDGDGPTIAPQPWRHGDVLRFMVGITPE